MVVQGDSDVVCVEFLFVVSDIGYVLYVEFFNFVMGVVLMVKMLVYCVMVLGSQINSGDVFCVKVMFVVVIVSWFYIVYYGLLYGQINDFDGGGDFVICNVFQFVQIGKYGLDIVFFYVKGRGLDFFVNIDYNYYFDGSLGLGIILVVMVKDCYIVGLVIVVSVMVVNFGFLVLYGMEWGVISGGGYLNIFNSDEFYFWEYDLSNQFYGYCFVVKNDYVMFYSVM